MRPTLVKQRPFKSHIKLNEMHMTNMEWMALTDILTMQMGNRTFAQSSGNFYKFFSTFI